MAPMRVTARLLASLASLFAVAITATFALADPVRDLLPEQLYFLNHESGTTSIELRLTAHTIANDTAHVTSAEVYADDVLVAVVPLDIPAYSGGALLSGSCWFGTGVCPSRTCYDNSSCQPVLGDVCSCAVKLPFPFLAEIDPGQSVRVVVDPSNQVLEFDETNNTLIKLFDPAETPQASDAAFRVDVAPNPFRGSVEIRWMGSGAIPRSISVHDAGGRLCRTLLATHSRDGAAPVWIWDGRDDRGANLPPGVFFVRADAAPTRLIRCLLKLD